MNLLTNERHVLEMQALLVERQVPLTTGVRLASEMSVDPFIRQRALELADDIEQGKPGWFRTHRHWVGAELLHQASTPEMLSERLRIVITMLQNAARRIPTHHAHDYPRTDDRFRRHDCCEHGDDHTAAITATDHGAQPITSGGHSLHRQIISIGRHCSRTESGQV